MSYRFGVGSLPGPRFTASSASGYGIFFTVPISPEAVDGGREKIAVAQDKSRKRRSLPIVWNLATGELARLASLAR